MANLEVVEAPAPAEASVLSVGGRRNKLLTLGLVAGAVIAGVTIGLLLIAPQFASRPAGASASTPAQASKGESAVPASIIQIENVVVNPAGAEGSHFLMATVTVEVRDKLIEERLRANEHVLKDIVMNTLSQETMDMLRQPGARDQLKASLARAIDQYVSTPDAVTVFLPEFVVQ